MQNFQLPSRKEISYIFCNLSKREIITLAIFLVMFLFSMIVILEKINRSFMVEVPMRGGSLSEGIVGNPRLINPITLFSNVDQDMVTIIYSGLLRKDIDGNLIPDLAEKYKISEDKLSYTFTLKDNIYFHDDEEINADDVIFTVKEIKNSILKNSSNINWNGITAEKIDQKTIKFTLKQPYNLFLENLTIGIMPEHIWNNGAPIELNEYNINPIGSGPYKIKDFTKGESGTITSYKLVPFEKFALGKQYIEEIDLHFYKNEDDLIEAFLKKEIDQMGLISASGTGKLGKINNKKEFLVLSRVFGLFFNQNQNQLFTNTVITKAIEEIINKEAIVKEAIGGHGIVANGPIPLPIYKMFNKELTLDRTKKQTEAKERQTESQQEKIQRLEEILKKDGWNRNENGILEKSKSNGNSNGNRNGRSKNKKTKDKEDKENQIAEFSISTVNTPDLLKAAELIRTDLLSIGIKANIKIFEQGDLNQNVIRPRKYESLLFGEIINHETDFFAFWHSSQRNDPGLNIAMYTNAKVDDSLEQAAIIESKEQRANKYIEFMKEIEKDIPAVFLYNPAFVYVMPQDLKGFKNDSNGITGNYFISPRDRFLNIHSWYLKTDNVWKVFVKK